MKTPLKWRVVFMFDVGYLVDLSYQIFSIRLDFLDTVSDIYS